MKFQAEELAKNTLTNAGKNADAEKLDADDAEGKKARWLIPKIIVHQIWVAFLA